MTRWVLYPYRPEFIHLQDEFVIDGGRIRVGGNTIEVESDETALAQRVAERYVEWLQRHFPGASDASHAWLSVHCPRHGWVDLDPTNDVVPEQRHVTVAWGRDYGDVSPLRGVILGGSHHTLRVGVSVRTLEGSEREEALATAAAGSANGPRIA